MSASPLIDYPALPVSQLREDILQALAAHQVVVVVGDTGSGKTTQLPKMALEHLLSTRSDLLVGCTQPRRIAATSVAKRVGEELLQNPKLLELLAATPRRIAAGSRTKKSGRRRGPGSTQPQASGQTAASHAAAELHNPVGYQVRFEDHSDRHTCIKFMTDGILLMEAVSDRQLSKYGVLIIDEAHERSLNIDFILGYVKQLLKKRADLRIIISSATIDAQGFSDFFGQAPIISVEGRTFPVDVSYLPALQDEELSEHVRRGVQLINQIDARGDILVFLPGEREILEAAKLLKADNYPATHVLGLYARLSMAEQQLVFQPQKGLRRIILATNVAETSLTIPGIVYVLDSGLARVGRYSPRLGLQRLQLEYISQASARQRMGRCGRVSAGICLRLYGEEQFKERFSAFSDPEIRRSSLAQVILRLACLGLPSLHEFDLPNPPAAKLINEGYATLRDLGALDDKRQLTRLGRDMAALQIDPPLARCLIEAKRQNCVAEMCVIVSALSLNDVRERPQEQREKADMLQREFLHEEGDFMSILKLWYAMSSLHDGRFLQKNKLRAFCKKYFLNFKRCLEWDNLHGELRRNLLSIWHEALPALPSAQNVASAAYIHRALLAGNPRCFGVFDRQKRCYKAPFGGEFRIFPASGMAKSKRAKDWIMGVELVETSQLFMRKCAAFNPEWLEQVAKHLCSYHYGHMAYDAQQGMVYAKERVSVGGIVIIAERRVHYGRIDALKAAEIYLQEAIIAAASRLQHPWLQGLYRLMAEAKDIEQRLRRPDQVFCAAALQEWLQKQLGTAVYSDKGLLEFLQKNHPPLPQLEHLLYLPLSAYELEKFPPSLQFAGQTIALEYHHEPGEKHDGLCFNLQLQQLEHIPEWLVDWGVEGYLQDKCEALLANLPKQLRLRLPDAAEGARRFIASLGKQRYHAPLEDLLARWVENSTLLECKSSWLDFAALPAWMDYKVSIFQQKKQLCSYAMNFYQLREQFLGKMQQQLISKQQRQLAKQSYDDFPAAGVQFSAQGLYQALVWQEQKQHFVIEAMACAWQATRTHQLGVCRLLARKQAAHLAFLLKKFPLDSMTRMQLMVFGQAPQLFNEDLSQALLLATLQGRRIESAQQFADFELDFRQNGFEYACRLAKNLASYLQELDKVKLFIEKHAAQRFYAEIAADLSQQLAWLSRAYWLSWYAADGLAALLRYAKGMVQRIERLSSQPVQRELERMQKLQPWLAKWQKLAAEEPQSARAAVYGELLQELRLGIFAQNLQLRGGVDKQLLSELEQM